MQQSAEAEAKPVETVDLEATIREAAVSHGVNPDHFLAVAQCEDPGLIVDQESNVIRKDGTREPSFGIFQIDLEMHHDISVASATDPVWAANWAAEQWANGDASYWTCYRLIYD